MATLLHRDCPICQKPFTCSPSNPVMRCSTDCYQAARGIGKKETIICAACGKPSEQVKSEHRTHCNAECAEKTAASKRGHALCGGCQKPFTYSLKRPQKYCSSDCYDETRRQGKRETALCLTCKEPFTYLKSWPHQYCSPRCSGKAMIANIKKFVPTRHEKICEECKKPFIATAKRGPFRFCSPGCNADWQCRAFAGSNNALWKGGAIDYYGASWATAKRAVRKRDQSCQGCGISRQQCRKRFDVHHITPFRVFGVERHEEANALTNLLGMCRSCHMRREWADNRRSQEIAERNVE